jgi:ATP-dependent Clp protease protease subunit
MAFRPSQVSLSIPQRKIYLCDDIDDETAYQFLTYVNKLLEFDERMGTKQPIEILINSNGGSVEQGFSIISIIHNLEQSGYEVITTNIGAAYSMGFLIAICGTKRKCYKYSRYMVHDISSGAIGKRQAMIEDIDECNALMEIINSLIIEKTNLTEEQLKYWLERKQDKYFSPKDALELGIVDEIVFG